MIPQPCNKEVEKYLKRWDSLENYVLQERSLDKLFKDKFPHNTEIEDILIKVSTLNDFYSTNIYSVFPVAKHILEMNIDERLYGGDPTLVSEIAVVNISGKTKNFYSFASKYCSHHNQDQFPIYDSYVEKVLMYFRKVDGFSQFRLEDLKDYPIFKGVLVHFADYYGIKGYGLKDLDRYLWQLGKEFFPKKY
ncbi:MAG: hypothetical protein E7307_01265 [Butyrivibrio sp.]|nr:hypothetical protein [Butyrivibrio sp.]